MAGERIRLMTTPDRSDLDAGSAGLTGQPHPEATNSPQPDGKGPAAAMSPDETDSRLAGVSSAGGQGRAPTAVSGNGIAGDARAAAEALTEVKRVIVGQDHMV